MQKKQPARRCIACNEQKDKKELLRIVRTPEGNIEIDLTGKKFGKLEVLTKVPKPEHLKSLGTYWLCRCTCGKEKIIYGKCCLGYVCTNCR